MTDLSSAAMEGRFDTVLLGRLGHELALVYHDTLNAPLPAGLKALIERLDHSDRAARAETGSKRDE